MHPTNTHLAMANCTLIPLLLSADAFCVNVLVHYIVSVEAAWRDYQQCRQITRTWSDEIMVMAVKMSRPMTAMDLNSRM